MGLPACEIANYEKQFNTIYYDMAEKLAGVLNIDVELLLDDYTSFTRPGFGQRIKEIRAMYGISQAKFSEMLGVTRSTASIWEIELHRPSRKHYNKLMEYKKSQEGRNTK